MPSGPPRRLRASSNSQRNSVWASSGPPSAGRGGFHIGLDPTLATTAIRSIIRGAGVQALLDDPQRIDAVMGMMAELFLHWLVTGAPSLPPPRSPSPRRRGSGSTSTSTNTSGSRARRPRAARASD